MVRDFDAGAGDVLRFANVLHNDFERAVAGIEDDGHDVTIRFQDDSSLTLNGLGTGAIGTFTDLLSEIGNDSVEMVA